MQQAPTENVFDDQDEMQDQVSGEHLEEVEAKTEQVIVDEPSDEAATEEKELVSDETQALHARIRELEQEISAREELSHRVARECTEFETYFPEVSLKCVPDEVWGQVHAGIPLSAAYALYEKKQQKQMADATRISRRGESITAGIVDAAGNEYFSPSQVRAMSQSEVRQNYDRIFESMRHWQ